MQKLCLIKLKHTSITSVLRQGDKAKHGNRKQVVTFKVQKMLWVLLADAIAMVLVELAQASEKIQIVLPPSRWCSEQRVPVIM